MFAIFREKRKQRPLAFLMVMALLLSMVATVSPKTVQAAGTETDVVKMIFTENPFGAGTSNTGNLSTTPITTCNTGVMTATLGASSTAVVTYTGSSKTLWTYGWEKGGYWQIDFSSKGYENLTFSADMFSTSKGPRDFEIQYSTDGVVYVPVEETEVQLGSALAVGKPYKNVKLPAATANAERLSIRLVITSAVSQNGGELSSATGANSRIANIIITGTPGTFEPSEKPTLDGVSIFPSSGEITSDTPIIINYLGAELTATSGSALVTSGSAITINYKVDNGGWRTYTEPLIAGEIAKQGNEFTIAAYASAEGYNNGATSSATYTTPITISSIADVLADTTTGTTYQIEGVVTFIDGKNVYIQDATGAMNAYCLVNVTGIAIGDNVVAKGERGAYSGLQQLSSATVTKTDGVLSFEPETVTIDQLTANSEQFECKAVKIENVRVGKINTSGTTPLTVGEASINLFKIPAIAGLMEGDSINLTAVVSDFNGVQLRVVDAGKITKIGTESSIAEAREGANNSKWTVRGVVSFIEGKNVYLEDATAAIVVNLPVEDTSLKIGNYLVVTGTRATIKGLEELVTSTGAYEVKGTSSLFATPATIAEIIAKPNAYEGKRVKISDAVIGKMDTAGNTSLTQSGANINIYKIPVLDAAIKKDATVSLYAIVSDYDGVQLRMASAGELIAYKNPSTGGEPEVYDPITKDIIPAGVSTIADIYALPVATGTVTVIGQVAYVFGNFNTMNSAIIQDVENGEVIGLQIYNALANFKLGDIITVTGTVTDYGNVRQIQNLTASAFVSKGEKTIPAQEVTIPKLKNDNLAYVSEYVVIKGVTLGEYNGNGSTTITDADGNTFPIYRAATYPDNIVAGDVVDVYGVSSKFNTTYQLRVGSSESYKKSGSVEVDTSIVLPILSIAGTKAPTATTVYGDINAENDGLDTSTEFTLSTGGVPAVADTQLLGSKGLNKDQYYQIKTKAYGYGNMNLTFSMRGSKTGAKNFKILYSTDGVNYVAAGNGSVKCSYTQYGQDGVGTPVNYDAACTNGTFALITDGKYHTVSFALPENANHAETLYIRIMVLDAVSIGGTVIGTGGTNYITSIALTGSPVVDNSICGVVTATPAAGQVKIGEAITLTSKTAGATIYYSFDGSTYAVYDKENKPVLTTLPAVIHVYASKDGVGDSIKTNYKYTQARVATVKGSPNGGAVNLNSTLKLTCETEGSVIQYSMDEGKTWKVYNGEMKLETLPVTVLTYATKQGYLDGEVKTLSFTKRANEEYNIYYGQLHSHTAFSDGAGSCDDAFKYASTQADQIDFLAVTDHSNSFDNDTIATIKDGSASKEWVEGHELAKKYTSETFVGLYGYEMTWSGGAPGHMNTFNTDGFLSRNMAGFGNGSSASLPNYYAQLKTVPESISQFNHPGSTFGDFYDFGYYDAEIDELITVIEVGNGEGAVGSSGYFPSYEYYTRALDKGWHVAPTNNQDNHKGKWGDANTGRTVILADTLTEESVYDALRNMRVYATEDNNLKVWYTLNGADMGTIMDEKPDAVEIIVKAEDETANESIGKIEVIVNGGLSVASETMTSNKGEVKFNLSPNYSYYYIRITQKDGDITVTAPIWISKVEAVGISSIATTTSLAVKGEPVDVKTTLYNNEASALNVKSITYTVDDQVICEVDLQAAGITQVNSLKEASHSFIYTHNGLGKTDIYVTVVAEYNGVQKIYKEVLQLNYVAPSMVTRVIVDGTHNNDYVTGYYGGNVGNFADIAAGDNVQVNVVTDKITREMLEDCSLLILSAPAKKSGTYNSAAYDISHFEDEFIALVKEYVAAGGNVVFCGLADYQDSASAQSSTEINKMLTAIGATTRLNSDELMDDVKNGGQNYRLYFTNFNRDSIYLKGVTQEQEYSAYSGCGVLLNAEAVASGKAEALVYGHESTYSIDSKSLDGNYVETPKGTIVALAHEKLDSGSNIFVAGTVFLSDFEVKSELDNASESYYANRNILLNILAENKVQLATSTIKTVRQAPMGEIFAIEGYVTAGTAVPGNVFFDTIYVEDDTAGITVFPVAEAGIAVGQKIRIVGFVDSYQGDKEIMVISYELLNDSKIIAPTEVTTKEAADYENHGGGLLKVTGVVTKVEIAAGDVKYVHVKDNSGVEAKVFIDGYITSSTGVDNVKSIAKVGNTISAVGLNYMNPEGVCLRVRDRAEIILIKEGGNIDTNTPGGSETTTPGSATTTTVTKDADGNTVTETVTTKTDVRGNKVKETVKVTTDKNGKVLGKVVVNEFKDIVSGSNVVTVISSDADGKEISTTATVEAGAKATILKDGNAEISYQLPVDILLELAKNSKTFLDLKVTVPTAEAVKAITSDKVKQITIISVIPRSLSQNKKTTIGSVILGKELLLKAKENGTNLSVKIVRETGTLVSEWTFLAKNLVKNGKDITDVNLATYVSWKTVDRVNKDVLKLDKALSKGVVLEFMHQTILPGQATVKLYVGTRNGIRANSTVYVYQLDAKSGKLKELNKTEYQVDMKGYLTLDLVEGSNYIILPKAASKKVITTQAK